MGRGDHDGVGTLLFEHTTVVRIRLSAVFAGYASGGVRVEITNSGKTGTRVGGDVSGVTAAHTPHTDNAYGQFRHRITLLGQPFMAAYV
jgi:hypothetical protein